MNFKNIIFRLLLSVAFPILDIISFEYKCNIEEYMPKLYGFPFIYRTQIPYVNSLEGHFFISGFLLNALFFFVLFSIIFYGFNRIKANKKIILIASRSAIIILFVLGLIFFSIITWTFKWNETEVKSYAPDTTWERNLKALPKK